MFCIFPNFKVVVFWSLFALNSYKDVVGMLVFLHSSNAKKCSISMYNVNYGIIYVVLHILLSLLPFCYKSILFFYSLPVIFSPPFWRACYVLMSLIMYWYYGWRFLHQLNFLGQSHSNTWCCVFLTGSGTWGPVSSVKNHATPCFML